MQGFTSMETDTRYSDSISALPDPLLAPKEPRAPVTILSPAQRTALLACLESGMLHRHRGAWVRTTARAGEKRIAGITIADLARDGFLNIDAKRVSAQLTARGSWFARTAAELATRGSSPEAQP
jgi:hypothetical protein